MTNDSIDAKGHEGESLGRERMRVREPWGTRAQDL